MAPTLGSLALSPMRYRRFEPLDRDLSVLVLGTSGWDRRDPEIVQALTDAWLELGGNAFDSGRHYRTAEAILAECLGDRRRDVALLTKGAHHEEAHEDGPVVRRRLTRDDISRDLHASLEALRTNVIDIYMLHRDDPSQPVGPILEELNEHLRAGRVRSFGASNWTTARVDEAARYAAEHDLTSFTSSSVYLGLAEQLESPWVDTVSARGADARSWYERTQLPLFPWSAQAGGFFAGHLDERVQRVYGSDGNAERLRRSRALADERGATANQVALAWVLAQPFPTYAVVGPRTVGELRESAEAVELELSADDVAWLDLTGDRPG